MSHKQMRFQVTSKLMSRTASFLHTYSTRNERNRKKCMLPTTRPVHLGRANVLWSAMMIRILCLWILQQRSLLSVIIWPLHGINMRRNGRKTTWAEEEMPRVHWKVQTHLFEWHCVSFSALAVCSRNALHKSTFYLLTYLLARKRSGSILTTPEPITGLSVAGILHQEHSNVKNSGTVR